MANPNLFPQRPSGPEPPPVRIEVHNGSAKPVVYDLSGDEFLVGSVPGCDLRLPGTNLPSVICLIARQVDGVRLRKLTPTVPVLVNGQPVAQGALTLLSHGDTVSVGAVDLRLDIAFSIPPAPQFIAVAPPSPAPAADELPPPLPGVREAEWARRERDLETRQKAVEEKETALAAERILWHRRREELEREVARRVTEPGGDDGGASPSIDGTGLPVTHDLRADLEREVSQRFQERNQELDDLQLRLREMTLELRDQRQRFEEELRSLEPRRQELAAAEHELKDRQAELEQQLIAMQSEREAFDARAREERAAVEAARSDIARREEEAAARAQVLAEREAQINEDRKRAAECLARYQADLERVDRQQAALEQKEKELDAHSRELEERWERFHNDAREMEEHVRTIDERQEVLRRREEEMEGLRHELAEREADLAERASRIEAQQAMLTTLRARVEDMRDEVRAQSAGLAAEQARHAETARELQEKLREAERLREELLVEKMSHAEGSKLFQDRSALMQQAVTRLRELQEQLRAEDSRLSVLDQELQAKGAQQAEEAALLQSRSDQLLDLQRRLEADRDALRQRESALNDTASAREELQQQLVRRSEDLAGRTRELDEKARQLEEQTRLLNAQADELEKLRGDAGAFSHQTDARSAELASRDRELVARAEQLRQVEESLATRRNELDQARQRWEEKQREAEDRQRQSQVEIAALRNALDAQAAELARQMPGLEQRAQAALERTVHAREQLRGQLAELHAYARQSQDDLEALRAQVQDETERLRRQEAQLSRNRSEHRLAVASFKQQLLEWQARFAGMKQTLGRNESRVGQRAAEVEATSQALARQAEELELQQREVERHLHDMRDWLRAKLREVVETRSADRGTRNEGPGETPAILPLPANPSAHASAETRKTGSRSGSRAPRSVLSLVDDLDPGDRRLGELLRSLGLVEADTLAALWAEAHRQRRPLRQVLLAGGYLTLYQLALIEAGNLHKLVIGRFRIIDRVAHSTRETIYRVSDPQSGGDGTCILRHLGDAETEDPVHPDEYRQRFLAARDLGHPNIAATLEVLDVSDRPAVVQEWLRGLPGGEWPALAGVPGVWLRILSQAALGLHAAHQAGLTHGRLSANSFVMTGEGVLKIAGFGEPLWLSPALGPEPEPSMSGDLKALGEAALHWSQLHAEVKPRRGRTKPFASELLGVLLKLGADTGAVAEAEPYPNAAALLDDLDRLSSEVRPAADDWEKFLAHVAKNQTDAPLLRRSA
jgi:DNA repair exonuclease SbcCD ATPase subunit